MFSTHPTLESDVGWDAKSSREKLMQAIITASPLAAPSWELQYNDMLNVKPLLCFTFTEGLITFSLLQKEHFNWKDNCKLLIQTLMHHQPLASPYWFIQCFLPKRWGRTYALNFSLFMLIKPLAATWLMAPTCLGPIQKTLLVTYTHSTSRVLRVVRSSTLQGAWNIWCRVHLSETNPPTGSQIETWSMKKSMEEKSNACMVIK